MIQCRDCELFANDDGGRFGFKCDPFTNIKDPTCITKWQLIKIDQMVQAYQATLDYYQRLAPMQEKMFKVMEREMGDLDESERWKVDDDDDDPADPADPADPTDAPDDWPR